MQKTKVLLAISLFAFSLIRAPQVAYAGWQFESIDSYEINSTLAQSTDFYAAIGNDGTIHVLYLKDNPEPPLRRKFVIYAYKDESGWHNEDITRFIRGAGVPYQNIYLSLSLDSKNNVYISYPSGRILYLMTNSSGAWITEAIFADVDDLYGPANIVFDSHDNPHTAFHYGDKQYYEFKDSSGWHIATVEEGFDLGFMALDSNDYPHGISLQEQDENYKCSLTYAYKDSSGWHTEAVGGRKLYCATDFSMALDPDDKAHILFADSTQDGLIFYYTTNASGKWVTEVVINKPFDDVSLWFTDAIVLDADNKPHLSYTLWNDWDFILTFYFQENSIWHATRDLSGWNKTMVKQAATLEMIFWPLLPSYKFGSIIEAPPTIKMDPDGNPHLFYLSTSYIYPYYLQNFPDFPFKGVKTYWNHAYFEP